MIYYITFGVSMMWVCWVIYIVGVCKNIRPTSEIPLKWMLLNTCLTILLMVVCAVNTLANL